MSQSPSDLALIQKDVQPFLDADKPWDGDFFPRETRRINGLAAKSKVFMEKIVCDKTHQSVCTKLLSSTSKNYLGQELQASTSYPQLNNTFTLRSGLALLHSPCIVTM
ncbi:uncharacterized protein PV06_11277 [Exophiala oligosperma]|uniref:Uncharacterized protein n=1 Tax=Exophiala oligosperma TaxID=215243 RepID=A0A0D2A822_9EURO|nr:uncharacterized protein PV06_11277 [Exophiala oligosperma]KIW36461.1 hypothetical protein PV06_11277 [Exophiala oligosperma]